MANATTDKDLFVVDILFHAKAPLDMQLKFKK
jgi:hypothetical protein